MRKKKQYDYSHEFIKQSILEKARAASLPDGWATSVAENVANTTDRWIRDKDTVTEDDLRDVVVDRLLELSPDLAFVYQNHDKII